MVEGNGTKMGEKWDEIPIPPIFLEVEEIPHSSLCKNQLTALTDGKTETWAFLPLTDTHRHGNLCERLRKGRCEG